MLLTVGRTVRLAYVRLDVSGLADKAEIPISIKRGADATVPLGGGAASGAVTGVVGVVAMGMAVTADPAAGLACAGSQALPTVTATEGFKGAWASTAMYVDSEGMPQSKMSPMIKIILGWFPRWGQSRMARGRRSHGKSRRHKRGCDWNVDA